MTPTLDGSRSRATVAAVRALAVTLVVLTACSGGTDAPQSSASAPASPSVSPSVSPSAVPTGSAPDTTAGESAVTDSGPDEPSGVEPEGFTTATVRITDADGATCEVCMWLADEAAERSVGLMGVTDLGDAAGMVFVFDQPTSGAFFMYRTVTPLSIAWFAPGGDVVSSTDMAPCVDDDSTACERFFPDGPYQLAIEVFRGDLAAIGIDAGSRAEVVAGTEAAFCALADPA